MNSAQLNLTMKIKGIGSYNKYNKTFCDFIVQEWVQVLRSCCSKAGWTTQSQRGSRKRRVKQLKSLRLRILEAHNISSKQIPHAYCVVSLNEVKVGRTPVQQAPNPVWDEEFMFE